MAEYSGKITLAGLLGGPGRPPYIPEEMGAIARRRGAEPPTVDINDEPEDLTQQETPSRTSGIRRQKQVPSRGESIFAVVLKEAPEPVTGNIDKLKEKSTEAVKEELATVTVDPVIEEETQGLEPEPNFVTEVADTSEQFKNSVVASFRGVGTGAGLSPGAADFTAGVATNLILAPIMGPLEKAETYMEIAGIVIGVTTGAHGLALACAKLLLKRQAERLFEEGVTSLLHGPRTAQPQSDPRAPTTYKPRLATDSPDFKYHESVAQPAAHDREQHSIVRPAHFPGPQDAPEMRWEPTPNDPLWLCLAFIPKRQAHSSAAHAGTASGAVKRDATKPVVLPLGDDAFLRTLPEALRGRGVREEDAQTLQMMRDMPAGRHFIVQMEGISFGTSSAKSNSQAALQHPGCLEDRCEPLDGPRCSCTCSVCRP